MNPQKYLVLIAAAFTLLLSGSVKCNAQIVGACVDSTQVHQGFFCDTSNLATAFQPVCGCNAKTYFNICAAQNYYGVMTYQGGPCEPIAFVLWPVPSNTELNIVLAVKDLSTYVHVTIFAAADSKIAFDNIYSLANVPSGVETEQIDVSTFPRGVYLVMATTLDGSFHVIHKFVKLPTG